MSRFGLGPVTHQSHNHGIRNHDKMVASKTSLLINLTFPRSQLPDWQKGITHWDLVRRLNKVANVKC